LSKKVLKGVLKKIENSLETRVLSSDLILDEIVKKFLTSHEINFKHQKLSQIIMESLDQNRLVICHNCKINSASATNATGVALNSQRINNKPVIFWNFLQPRPDVGWQEVVLKSWLSHLQHIVEDLKNDQGCC
jgi:hypothetical protein